MPRVVPDKVPVLTMAPLTVAPGSTRIRAPPAPVSVPALLTLPVTTAPVLISMQSVVLPEGLVTGPLAPVTEMVQAAHAEELATIMVAADVVASKIRRRFDRSNTRIPQPLRYPVLSVLG